MFRCASTILTAVPLALAGGVFAPCAAGHAVFDLGAVSFIAVSGVALLNGLVLSSAIDKRLADGVNAATTVIDGALAAGTDDHASGVAGLGGDRDRHRRRNANALASVVIGGQVTSTILTLFILAAIRGMALRRRQRRPPFFILFRALREPNKKGLQRMSQAFDM